MSCEKNEPGSTQIAHTNPGSLVCLVLHSPSSIWQPQHHPKELRPQAGQKTGSLCLGSPEELPRPYSWARLAPCSQQTHWADNTKSSMLCNKPPPHPVYKLSTLLTLTKGASHWFSSKCKKPDNAPPLTTICNVDRRQTYRIKLQTKSNQLHHQCFLKKKKKNGVY